MSSRVSSLSQPPLALLRISPYGQPIQVRALVDQIDNFFRSHAGPVTQVIASYRHSLCGTSVAALHYRKRASGRYTTIRKVTS